MFAIEYELDNLMIISDVQQTIAETLFDAELVAVVGCGQRLQTDKIQILYSDDLEYVVFVDGIVKGGFRIKVLSDSVNVSG